MRRPLLSMTVALAGALCAAATDSHAALPPVKHAFVIVLENENADTSFGPSSPAPYLAHTLPSLGEFVPNYFGTGHASLDNYIAMISGQAPNIETQADCPIYRDITPGTISPDGQALGSGCVYPAAVKTVADQLVVKGLTWRGYMQDMGADPTREPATCAHPDPFTADHTQAATPKDQYATRHDPFVYFHSITDTPACGQDVVNLDRLGGDLATAATTPNLVFITPDLCNDGHDATCADGGPGGLRAAGGFLAQWVPRILSSPAYAEGGLLAVVFDEGSGDSSACCGETSGPNTPAAGGESGGPGGGRTGAVLVSPFVRPGSVTTAAYNHYGLLRSIEDLFGLDHLGFAAAAGVKAFGDDVFTTAPGLAASSRPRVRHRRCRPLGRRRHLCLDRGHGRRAR